MNQELDSFSKVLEVYLVKLDKSYQDLREIAADPMFLNTSHKMYKGVYGELEETLDDIFKLKAVWYEARKLGEKDDSR